MQWVVKAFNGDTGKMMKYILLLFDYSQRYKGYNPYKILVNYLI